MITGDTATAAVIGWPVEHSRSPAIHNAAAAAVGADLVYTALRVAPGEAGAAVAAMRTLGIRGFSVTMPHKEAVIPALDELTVVASALGAVNHITNNDGHLVGNNTDGAGFLIGLEHSTGLAVDQCSVGVFGAGGAARAIIHACTAAGASVVVVARDAERAAGAAAVGGSNAQVGSVDDFDSLDVVVNATPVGMAGSAESMVPFDVASLQPDAVVVDIVYNPLQTALLAAAKGRGLVTVDGLAMLVGQAAAQFEAWTGHDAPLDVMRQAAYGE